MKDDIWKRDEIESPCVKLCMIHPEERICVGCHRTLDEIAGWSRLTPEARRAVMAELPARAPRLARRRGGHAGRTSG
ncbi:DUF1289 domain-containing protein [Cereibacter sphaeroides]|uniref:DUF1289 domain-containing protein n=2 Tax=Cereibacter johrii TaxID=445629 RepID=A0ABX5JEX5_9RHOB|nr:DUF1289 domain-containing protein [Cereibacter johrii]PTM79954.1 hypothetical protein C8J29_10222 [Cereibacter johrii]QCP85663.1 DUF1289 domain-containing protein [Cereibacter sphaeroides]